MAQAAPFVPHSRVDVPAWHPVELQQPLAHEVALHAWQLWLMQYWFAGQLAQAAPPIPQV
jgi:hypothetical protein